MALDLQPVLDLEPVEESSPVALDLEPIQDEQSAQPTTIADWLARGDDGVTVASPVTQGALPSLQGDTLSAVPKTEGEAIQEQVPEGDTPAMIGTMETKLPRFGEEGSFARGVSEVASGLGEFAINSPVEAAAGFNPATAAWIGIKYGPQIFKQTMDDLYAAYKGDKQAAGRAAAMIGSIAAPAIAKRGVRSIREAALETRYQQEYGALIDRIAREQLATRDSAGVVVEPSARENPAVIMEPSTEVKLGAPEQSLRPDLEVVPPGTHEQLVPESNKLFNQEIAGLSEQRTPATTDMVKPAAEVDLKPFEDAIKDAFSEDVPGVKQSGDKSGYYVVTTPDPKIPEDIANAVGPFEDFNAAKDYFLYDIGGEGAKLFEADSQGAILQEVEPYATGKRVAYSEDPSKSVVTKDIGKEILGTYNMGTGEVALDREALSKLSPEERASTVRHELAHKVETESELWRETDSYLWGLWERNQQHPIFKFMESKTGRWKFGNDLSPEIIANLYAEAYPKNTFSVVDLDTGKSSTHTIPAPMMRILDEIEGVLGIYKKKQARQSKAQQTPIEPNSDTVSVGKLSWVKPDSSGAPPATVSDPVPNAPSQPLIGMGGAVPGEFAPQRSKVTGIKNASVDLQRAERQLPPVMKPLRDAWPQVWDRAMAKMDADPALQDNLIRELKAKPRAATPEENVMLLQRMADLRNELDKARREQFQALDDGRLDAAASAELRAAEWSDRLNELENITETAGTWAGRNLAARKMMMNEDFTLAKLEQKAREALGEEKWKDPNQRKKALDEVRETADKFEKESKKLEEVTAEADKVKSDAQLDKTLADMKQAADKLDPPRRQKAKADAQDTTAEIEETSKAGKDPSSLIQKLARELVEAGISEREALVNAVHQIVADFIPDWTRRQTMDAISGYGKVRELDRTAAAVTLRDLKRQMQEVAKLEDMARGNAPLRTGWTREAPSDEVRRLQKLVEERKKAGGYNVTDPAKQLRTALDARKTRLTNQIADLERQIGSRTRDIKVRRDPPTNEEIEALKARRDVLKQEFEELFGKREISAEKRVEMAMRATEKSIAELEKKIAEGDLEPTKRVSKTPVTPELEAARAKRDALRAKLEELRQLSPGLQERLALERWKANANRRIEELTRRLKENDFERRTPREVKLDEEALTLNQRLDKIKREWYAKLLDRKLEQQTALRKLYRRGLEVLNVFRSFRTSYDLSAVFRQGKYIVVPHPIRAAKSIIPMLKAFASEREAFRVNQEILNRPNYPLYQRSKLFLSDHGVPLSKMEEAYMSRWAEKIPGVGASQRAYTTFLNKLRADSFDAMANSLGSSKGSFTLDEAKVISNYINVATGRGTIAMAEQAAVGLNSIFFAPRFVASRFQMALGSPLYYGLLSGKAPFRGTAKARALIAGEYARILAGYAVIYSLALAAGYKVGSESLSSDYGKIIIGKTRIDPLAGVSQVTVLMSRLAQGTKVNSKGKAISIVGKVPYGQEDMDKVIGNFTRSKLAPLPGLVWDLRKGSNIAGEPVPSPINQPLEFGMRYIGPISFADIGDLMKDQGVPAGTALTIINLLGESVQTYDSKKRK